MGVKTVGLEESALLHVSKLGFIVLIDIYITILFSSLWKVHQAELASWHLGLSSWGPQPPLSLPGVRVGVGVRSGVQQGSWITKENSLVPRD